MWFKVGVQLHFFACGYPLFPTLFAEKTVISLLNGLGILIKNTFDHPHLVSIMLESERLKDFQRKGKISSKIRKPLLFSIVL